MTRLLTVPSFVSRLAVGGSRTAIVTADDIAVSFEDLARRVDAVASQLGPGRRLVVIEPAGTEEAVTAYLGALRAGAVVLLAPAGGAPEFADRYRPSAVWTPETGFRFVPDAPERDLHPDLCLLLPTSGTTGSPRVVRLSYENVDANAAAIEGALGLGPDERAALVLPLSYCYGLSVLHSHLGAHGSVLLGMGSVTEDADWQRFTDLGGTSLAGVPRTFDLLERSGFADRDLPTLRTLTQAGGRMPPEQVARFARLGARRGFRLMVMYGQTEATARMAVLPADEAITHPGTIGHPVAGGRFELVPLVEGTAIGRVGSADDPIVPDGEVGELCYRGPNVMLGYARGPEDLGRGREIEVLRTGDLARRDPDGRYTIVGRRSRFVKPFGIRIDLDGLEAMLERAGIAAWCDGDDDGLRVLAEAGRADAVRRAVSERTRIPANRITVLEADPLPRLANGKPDRSRLRTAPVGSVAEGDLGVELAVVLGVVAVGDDDTFVGLGGDSLSYVEACGILERRIRRLPRDWPRRTVGELRALADSQPSRRWTTAVETSVVIRAVAIFFIVANHASWIPLQGGAHLLLVLAGYNYARFTLASPRRPVRRHGALLLRVGVPVLLAALLVAARLGLPDDGVRILLSQYVQPRPWRFWFGEALVHILVVCTLLAASTRFRTAERRRPLGTAVAVALAAAGIAVVSAAIWGRPAAPLGFEYRTEYVAWFFALGWVLARVTGPAARLAVSAVAVAVVPRFFDEPSRGAFVAAGILALTWIATITLPRLFARVLTVTAAASLAIYLVHYEDLYPYAREWSPFVVTVAGIVAGIAVHGIARAGKRVYVRVVRNRRNRAVPDVVPALAR